MQGNATNRARSGKKHGPDLPAVKKGQNGNDEKEDKLTQVSLESKRKKIELLEKTGFFTNDIPKGVQVEFFDEIICFKGPNPRVVKKVKDKVEQRIQDIKCKIIKIAKSQRNILTIHNTLEFIDYNLNIPKLPVTWEVVDVADQWMMIVFSFDEKKAKEMSERILACIAEETVSKDKSELPWFKDFCEKEQYRIIIDSDNEGNIKVFMTTDLRKNYFVNKRPPKSPQNKAAERSQLQKRASREQKDPTTVTIQVGSPEYPQLPRNRHVELERNRKAEEPSPNSKYEMSFDNFEYEVIVHNQQCIYLSTHIYLLFKLIF